MSIIKATIMLFESTLKEEVLYIWKINIKDL